MCHYLPFKLHKVLRQNSKTLKVLHQRKSLGNPLLGYLGVPFLAVEIIFRVLCICMYVVCMPCVWDVLAICGCVIVWPILYRAVHAFHFVNAPVVIHVAVVVFV
jgi:hypothetical protein